MADLITGPAPADLLTLGRVVAWAWGDSFQLGSVVGLTPARDAAWVMILGHRGAPVRKAVADIWPLWTPEQLRAAAREYRPS